MFKGLKDKRTKGPKDQGTKKPTKGLGGEWIAGRHPRDSQDKEARDAGGKFREFARFLLYRVDETVKARESLAALGSKRRSIGISETSETVRQVYERLRLGERAPGDGEKMKVVLLVRARGAPDDIRGD